MLLVMNKKNRNFKQGEFKPLYPDKYKGTYPILFRSALELRFMRWADSNTSVVCWSSESYIIPYRNPITNKINRYFIDNSIFIKDKEGNVKKFLIEIKPERQTKPPVDSNKKSTRTIIYEKAHWILNQAKWEAAKQFASSHDMRFIILNEHDLAKL